MLLDTLHEDSTPSHTHLSQAPPSAGDKGRGGNCVAVEQTSNQRTDEGQSRDLGPANQIANNEKSNSASSDKVSAGDEVEQGGGGGGGESVEEGDQREGNGNRSIVTDTFQGMLRNEVRPYTGIQTLQYVLLPPSLPHSLLLPLTPLPSLHLRCSATPANISPRRKSRLCISLFPCHMPMRDKSVSTGQSGLTTLSSRSLPPCRCQVGPSVLTVWHEEDHQVIIDVI